MELLFPKDYNLSVGRHVYINLKKRKDICFKDMPQYQKFHE